MPTACVIYGFCEGPRVGRRFESELRRAGYRIIRDPARAEVIIAHSGGSFLLPSNIRAKRILHIGLAYWPGKWWLLSLGSKLRRDLRAHHQGGDLRFWLSKTCWNAVYFVTRLPDTARMLAGRFRGRPLGHGHISIVARPRFDSFCPPDAALLPFATPPTLVSVGLYHDDCWRDPAPYIALLQS